MSTKVRSSVRQSRQLIEEIAEGRDLYPPRFKYLYDIETDQVRYADGLHGPGTNNRLVKDPDLRWKVIRAFNDGDIDPDGYIRIDE